MLAQRLRYTATLQQQATSVDAYGGNTGAWEDVGLPFRVGIEPIGGTEALKNGQNVAEQLVRVPMRYRAGVIPQMRLVCGADTYEILAVANRDGANRMLELTCRLGRSVS